MNVNLGQPYEFIIRRLIEKGYAGNQTEVIRQALLNYERQVEADEVILVHKGIDFEMNLVKTGKVKAVPLAKIKAKYER